ncbi:MAG TPA: recombinase RecF, partial [Solibacterales bacterium]|nr:recombinase RecF [Bryobacterales bacterium]
MIRRIKVSNYKSLRSLEVKLHPLSVLFGPNAAGKSNFIDALQLLSRIAASRTLKEAFEPPYRGKPMESFSFDEGGLEGLMGRDSVSFALEVDIQLSSAVILAVNREILESKRGQSAASQRPDDPRKSFIHHRELRYRIEIEVTPRSGVLHVADEYVVALGTDGRPKSRPQAFVERKGDRIHLRM